MSFSKALSKELKKRKNKETPKKDKKLKLDKDAIVPKHSDDVIGAVASETNGATQLTERQLALVNSITDEDVKKELEERNAFDASLDKIHKVRLLKKLKHREQKDARYKAQLEKEAEVSKEIDLRDITDSSSHDKLQTQLRVYIKELVKYWEETGDNEDLLLETKKDLVLLLYSLRSNGLTEDMTLSLGSIMYYLQHKDFKKANESYMTLSIGNVAYPIGLLNVTIHERSKLLKIETLGANIMIDDKTRRWITAVKRLITFSERASKTVLPQRRIGL